MLSFTRTIGAGGQFLLTKLTSALGRIKINPNLITLLGFAINIVAAFYLSNLITLPAPWTCWTARWPV